MWNSATSFPKMKCSNNGEPVIKKDKKMRKYNYKQSEPRLWTIGHYTHQGLWWPVQDCETEDKARDRTAELNSGLEPLDFLKDYVATLADTHRVDRGFVNACNKIKDKIEQLMKGELIKN